MSIAMVQYKGPPRSERHGMAITNVAGNLVYNMGSSADDDGWCKVATEVAPDVLLTVRFLILWAAIVAITMTVGIVLIELGPLLLVLLSRIVVDLPLAILNSLLVPLLDRLFVQLPLAIAHGAAWVASSVGHGVFWVVSSVGYGVFWVVSSVGYGVFWVVSSVGYGVFWVVSSAGYGVLWVVKSIWDIAGVLFLLLFVAFFIKLKSP